MLTGLSLRTFLLLLLSWPSFAQRVNGFEYATHENRALRNGRALVGAKAMTGNQIVATQIDGHVDYANACLIVGYFVNNRFTGNLYASNMYQQYVWKQQQARAVRGTNNNAPPVQRVGNVEELVRAIEKCPAGSPLVLASHGFAKWGGGFWLSEDPNIKDPHSAGIVIMHGNQGFNKLVDVLAKRRMSNVILHSCEVGKEAAAGRLDDPGDPAVIKSFGNKLANELYKTMHSQLKTDAEKLALPKAQVETYSEEVFGGTTFITAQIPGTRRLIFNTDEDVVTALNQGIARPEPQPVFAETTLNPASVASTPPQISSAPVPPPSQRPQIPQVQTSAQTQSAAEVPQSATNTFGDTAAPTSPSISYASPSHVRPSRAGVGLTNPFGNPSSNPYQSFPALAGKGTGAGSSGTSGSGAFPSLSSSGSSGGGSAKLAIDPIPPIKVPTFGGDFLSQVVQPSLINESSSYRWVTDALAEISGGKSK